MFRQAYVTSRKIAHVVLPHALCGSQFFVAKGRVHNPAGTRCLRGSPIGLVKQPDFGVN